MRIGEQIDKRLGKKKKLDCIRFAEEFEDIFRNRRVIYCGADILWLSSPYIIRREYLLLATKFNTKFSSKKADETAKIIKKIVDDEKCYCAPLLNYTPRKQAIERAKNSVANKFNQKT